MANVRGIFRAFDSLDLHRYGQFQQERTVMHYPQKRVKMPSTCQFWIFLQRTNNLWTGEQIIRPHSLTCSALPTEISRHNRFRAA